MLGSKNRDFKKEDRSIRHALKIHHDKMQELVKQGMTDGEASKQAFKEMKERTK